MKFTCKKNFSSTMHLTDFEQNKQVTLKWIIRWRQSYFWINKMPRMLSAASNPGIILHSLTHFISHLEYNANDLNQLQYKVNENLKFLLYTVEYVEIVASLGAHYKGVV